jgi:restriction system protein
LLSSGQRVFDNRVRWARLYLKNLNLIDSSRTGFVHITDEGRKALADGVPFVKNSNTPPLFKAPANKSVAPSAHNPANSPEELIDHGIAVLNKLLADELFEKIMNNTPEFFERLVLDLLTRMGYGEGKVTLKSRDGGIDGYVNQDALGIEKIYFQAKRYNKSSNIGSPDITGFIGALHLINADKGVFVTTSDFTDSAKQTAEKQNIILINGEKLLELMIKYNAGVSVERKYEIKKIDTDYFSDD